MWDITHCLLNIAIFPNTNDVEFAQTTQLMLEALFEKDYNRKTAEPMSLVDGTENVRALCIHAQNDPISEIENASNLLHVLTGYIKDMPLYLLLVMRKYFTRIWSWVYSSRIRKSRRLLELFFNGLNYFPDDQ